MLMWIFSFIFLFLFLSNPLHAFSEGVKKYFTHLHSRILLQGQKGTPEDRKQAWSRFDAEISALLKNGGDQEKSSAEYLNAQGAWTKTQVVDHEDVIDLGAIEMKFYPLQTFSGPAWLVSLYNGIGTLPSSTFRIYQFQKNTGKFVLAHMFEDIQGPWEKEQLLGSTIQIQVKRQGLPAQFTTYHRPPLQHAKSNRLQIVWEFNGETLKPTLWIPEVDWHLNKKGESVPGRGKLIRIR